MTDQQFYESSDWRRKRNVILRRDHYECQECKRYGRIRQATIVHHIKHLDEYPRLALDNANLESVCAECHNRLHPERTKWKPQTTDGHKILVIGNQGSGKTTWVKEHLSDGICYDLDAIASAFRLKQPHEEEHQVSQRIANELLFGFAINATQLSSLVFIIRTAPSQEELTRLKPDELVYLKKSYNIEDREDYHGITDYTSRHEEIIRYCNHNSIPVTTIE